MAFRLYIVPAIGSGTPINPRRPKYFDGFRYSGMDYGFQPIFLVAADLTAPQDAAIVANADVLAFPFDLDTAISGGAINTTRNAHEALLIPLQTVPATNRLLARYDGGLFQYMQRLNVILGNEALIDNSAKLNVQWQSIPANVQTAALEAAQSLGYDTSFIVGTTQLRAILKVWADAWGAQPFRLNEFSF
jgi:hypothetical protein